MLAVVGDQEFCDITTKLPQSVDVFTSAQLLWGGYRRWIAEFIQGKNFARKSDTEAKDEGIQSIGKCIIEMIDYGLLHVKLIKLYVKIGEDYWIRRRESS